MFLSVLCFAENRNFRAMSRISLLITFALPQSLDSAVLLLLFSGFCLFSELSNYSMEELIFNVRFLFSLSCLDQVFLALLMIYSVVLFS
jgi:hypothetical protein